MKTGLQSALTSACAFSIQLSLFLRHRSIVTVANLIPAPFATEVALALHERNLLDHFLTTYVWRSCPILESIARFVPRVEQRLKRRSAQGVPFEKIKVKPFWELARFSIGSIVKSRYVEDAVFHQGRDSFDRWVANQLTPALKAVYGFEYGSLRTFQRAKALGLKRFYDVPSPEHNFVESLLSEEFARFGEPDKAYRRYIVSKQRIRTQWRMRELELADIVIAASRFTKESYINAGIDSSKIRVIPYGAPIPNPIGGEGGSEVGTRCRFIWAGTFGIRKGAHYLLEAWRSGRFGDHATLDVYGAITLPSRLLMNLPDGVFLRGSISREDLYAKYRNSDALLFPTLCDGFGMVATEALANGLPVVLTQSAGAADLIDHQGNGLVIASRSAIAIREAITWCLDNRSALKEMRYRALRSIAGKGWDRFRSQIADTVCATI